MDLVEHTWNRWDILYQEEFLELDVGHSDVDLRVMVVGFTTERSEINHGKPINIMGPQWNLTLAFRDSVSTEATEPEHGAKKTSFGASMESPCSMVTNWLSPGFPFRRDYNDHFTALIECFDQPGSKPRWCHPSEMCVVGLSAPLNTHL